MNALASIRSWLQTQRLNAQIRALTGTGYAPAAPVLSGTYVTPETALGLTAVFCAINVVSRDVAALPRHVYRTLQGGGYEIEAGHHVEPLIGSLDPNDDMGRFRYVQTQMGHVLGRGNGLSEIVRSAGRPVAIELLHPVKTKPKRTAAGKLFYELENHKEILAEDVLHFAGLGFDGVSGYSPVTVCRQSVGAGLAVEQFGAAFFGNSAIPRGLLRFPKVLKEGALKNLRESWNRVHQGAQSAHQVAILEEGGEWVNTQISPEDSQFLQSRQFTVLEVARIFGVPPHKLQDYSSAHLANVEESNLDYLATTILGWVTMLDDEFSRKLLTRAERESGLVVMTDLRAMLRGNTSVRTTYYQAMRNMGAMSANDIRRAESLNPLPDGTGGELYLVQSQYTPLDQVGKAPPPAPRTSNRKRTRRATRRPPHVPRRRHPHLSTTAHETQSNPVA